MSEIATLENLEIHLSHSPSFRSHALANHNGSRRSALESFFSEIRYSSFTSKPTPQNANSSRTARVTYKAR